MRQVKAEHYSFLKYVNEARWLSYYTQIRETLSVNPRKVLVIGVGDHIVPDILEKILGGVWIHLILIQMSIRQSVVICVKLPN